jgi:signal transduction histidine kinase
MINELIAYGLTVIGSILLLVFVAAKKEKSTTKINFILFITSLIFWQLAVFLSGIVSSLDLELFLTRFGLVAGSAMVVFFFRFAYNFPDKKNKNGLIDLVIALVLCILIILSFLPSTVYFELSENSISYGIGYIISTIIVLLLFAAAIIKLFSVRFKDSKAKVQIDYILIGLSIAIIANVLVSFIFINISFANYLEFIGPLSILLFELLFATAIVKHQLFNLNTITARAASYSIAIIIIGSLYVSVFYGIGVAIFDINELSIQQQLFIITVMVAIAVLTPYLLRLFNRLTKKVFFKDVYDAQVILNEINSELVTSRDLHQSLQKIANIVTSKASIDMCNFYLDERAPIDFHTAGTKVDLFIQNDWDDLLQTIKATESKIITAQLNDEIAAHFGNLNIAIAAKMKVADEVVGILIVGQKLNGDEYIDKDIQLIEIIADEVAIAAQNALRYEEISQFAATLQTKVDEATRELQRSNEKLQKLDEAKDEFISMASHQLRTPLTSIKGYISMLLEGDGGEINETQKRFLDQAFLSSQRMVYLIADLLNVSRLKTGKFVIETHPTYLPDVVESEINQLYETAKVRELDLVFKKPDAFVTLNLDETKIRQVIMNFADNAIYYTPRGGRITIALKQLKNTIEYTVTDTGIGVPKKEQHHLFTKFYRAGNAKKARPDGTGLGLYMAKKVVVAQGGSIIFKTEEGKGSTFGFSFPIPKEVE